MRIIIVGTGPTGIGAAYRLFELGLEADYHQIIIFEQSRQPGGIVSSTVDNQGFTWDQGGHTIKSNSIYFNRILDFSNLNIINYNNLLCSGCLSDKINSSSRISSDKETHENIVEADRPILSNVLIKNHFTKLSDKMWCSSQEEYQFLSGKCFPPIDSIRSSSLNIDGSQDSQSIHNSKSTNNVEEGMSIKLDDISYPVSGGINSIWGNVSQTLPRYWFRYGTILNEIDVEKKRIFLSQGEQKFDLDYDVLISTIPLNKLLSKIRDKVTIKNVTNQFRYISLHLVGLGIKGNPPEFLQDKIHLYFPDDDIPFYKITILSNLSQQNIPEVGKYWSILCESSELIANDETGTDKTVDRRTSKRKNERRNGNKNMRNKKSQILSKLTESLKKYGILTSEDDIVSIHYQYLPYGYPLPNDEYASYVKLWLESQNIFSRGMFGSWSLLNQDEAFMEGVGVIDRIINGIPEGITDRSIIRTTSPIIHTYGYEKFGQSGKVFRPIRTPMVTFVVAHYQEDLSWLKQMKISDKCHVFNKGGQTLPSFDVWKWEQLPNVGRESHTYLHYIITNYDNLPEIVVFLQGRIDDHSSKVYQNPYQYVWEASINGLSFAKLQVYQNWNRIKHTGIWLTKQNNGSMKDAAMTLAEFWYILFKTRHPESIMMSHHACFAVRREKILARSLEFYKMAISYVSDHPDPEIGHYFERLWYIIFSTG